MGWCIFLKKIRKGREISFRVPFNLRKKPPSASRQCCQAKKSYPLKEGERRGGETKVFFELELASESSSAFFSPPAQSSEKKKLLFALDRITLDAYLGNGSGSGKKIIKRERRESFILFSRWGEEGWANFLFRGRLLAVSGWRSRRSR